MSERYIYTDHEKIVIEILRSKNDIPDNVPDEEVLPPMDHHIEYKTVVEEYRFGFSFPWRLLDNLLQERIIDYERFLAGYEGFTNTEMYYVLLLDEFKDSRKMLASNVAREIAERYDLWPAYPWDERPNNWQKEKNYATRV